MEKNVELPKINFSNIFKMIINFHGLYLLISFTLLLDVYLLIVFNFGFWNLNIPVLYNINNIKHIFFFSIIFGVTINQVSVLLYVILYKFLHKPDNNLKDYFSLTMQAIEEKNNLLMDYVKNESKKNKKIKTNYLVVYTFLISIIINSSVNNSILRNIINIFCLNNNINIKIYFGIIMLSIIVTVIFSVRYSIAFDEKKIYYEKPVKNSKVSTQSLKAN